MSTCKHASCTTPFCPACGKMMVPPGVAGEMLAYCRNLVKISKRNVEKALEEAAKAEADRYPGSAKAGLDRAARLKEIVEVWEKRLAWIESMIYKKGTP